MINWSLISNPVNWVIVWLMLLIGSMAITILTGNASVAVSGGASVNAG